MRGHLGRVAARNCGTADKRIFVKDNRFRPPLAPTGNRIHTNQRFFRILITCQKSGPQYGAFSYYIERLVTFKQVLGTSASPSIRPRGPCAACTIRLIETNSSAEHSGPVRLVVPGGKCFASIKWLDHLELRSDPGLNTAETIALA
jgi:hypothetical protein